MPEGPGWMPAIDPPFNARVGVPPVEGIVNKFVRPSSPAVNQSARPSLLNAYSPIDRSGVVKRVFFVPVLTSYASRYQRSDSKPGRRCATTKRVRPSDENCGCVSAARLALVTCRSSPPSTGTRKTSLFVVHASRSCPSRFETNASVRLSGEKARAASSCWVGGESKSPGVRSRARPSATVATKT